MSGKYPRSLTADRLTFEALPYKQARLLYGEWQRLKSHCSGLRPIITLPNTSNYCIVLCIPTSSYYQVFPVLPSIVQYCPELATYHMRCVVLQCIVKYCPVYDTLPRACHLSHYPLPAFSLFLESSCSPWRWLLHPRPKSLTVFFLAHSGPKTQNPIL